jgi:hypothetical protein
MAKVSRRTRRHAGKKRVPHAESVAPARGGGQRALMEDWG